MLALVNNEPKIMNILEMLKHYLRHQEEVVTRRTKYDLNKAEERAHILEGLLIALDNIDEVIKIIKEAETDVIAREKLIQRFGFDEIQANAILELKLRRLTGLERDKIENELADLIEQIKELKEILASEQKVLDIIKKELLEIKAKYADERRTNIDMTAIDYIEDESLIPEEDIIVTISDKGYIKRCVSSTFKSQHRGGVGIKGMSTNEEDYVKYLVNASTHDYILFFTNKGKVYRLKGYEIPEYSRQAKGLPIINLLQIEKDEKINSIISISNENDNKYLIFATRDGLVKKTAVEEYANIRTSGKIAISLKDGDELIDVKLSDGTNKVILGSTSGRMVVFNENEVRPMGRTASGVKGINLDGDYKCTGMEVGKDDDNLLIVTKFGYGKKTLISEYRMTKRGSKGVKALNVTDKNGEMIAHKIVNNDKDLLMITESGMAIRMGINQISQLGRVTQGVKLINLKDNQYVSTISILDKEETENEAEEAE